MLCFVFSAAETAAREIWEETGVRSGLFLTTFEKRKIIINNINLINVIYRSQVALHIINIFTNSSYNKFLFVGSYTKQKTQRWATRPGFEKLLSFFPTEIKFHCHQILSILTNLLWLLLACICHCSVLS